MKISFIATNEYAPWGASEELWSQTAMRMAKQGLTVSANVKGWKNEAKQISCLENSGCIVVRRNKNRIQKLISKFFPHRNFSFLDQHCPELVIISQAHNHDGLPWIEACIARNIPFVTIAHNASAESLWPCDDAAIRLAKAYPQAEQCFFISHANLTLTEKQLAVELKNAKVIANPLNVSYDIKIPWPAENKTLKLACVGRLEPWQKGQDLLFEILRLEKWRSRPIELSLFGTGINQQSLYELKQLWDLGNVTFSGFVDNVKSIWEDHHALILSSRFEAGPIVLVEAMLCARPCIATNVGLVPELIQDGVNGFVAIAPTVEYLDDAMERAWQKRDLWEQIGRSAAIDIRKVIPRDPIEVFVNDLKSLLK
ncbi:MAG: glycosyltransferase family 4 protein [Aphanocapsa sp. GSE-SYN-MK-11-07L]|nr:glycosyltransferase family 4 protein [Aphanocapsa sp. GSE-SYN-MK-11-07L]